MPPESLSHTLATIEQHAQQLLTDQALNHQQRTFITHIEKTAVQLKQETDPMPSSEMALRVILPAYGQALIQKIAVLYGYAQMLLTHPQSFDGAELSLEQQPLMQAIYADGMALAQRVYQIQESALTEQKAAQQAPASALDLRDVLLRITPIMQYDLREQAVQVAVLAGDHTAWVIGSAYHSAAIIRHIVRTIGTELMQSGVIQITLSDHTIHILCTNLEMTAEDAIVLLQRHGRYIYRKKFERYGGSLSINTVAGTGTTLTLHFPAHRA